MRRIPSFSLLGLLITLAVPAPAQDREPVILFVVGGAGTAGGPECGGAPGTHIECKSEHRASIHNENTFRGNHGWSEKAKLLRANGFELREVEEGPWNPVLEGVDRFDGEGVSPITIRKTLPDGVSLQVLARVSRVKSPEGNVRPSEERDGALIAGTAGKGRVAAFFDRNSFFNLNGAGTHLHRFENATLAGNLYRWLAERTD